MQPFFLSKELPLENIVLVAIIWTFSVSEFNRVWKIFSTNQSLESLFNQSECGNSFQPIIVWKLFSTNQSVEIFFRVGDECRYLCRTNVFVYYKVLFLNVPLPFPMLFSHFIESLFSRGVTKTTGVKTYVMRNVS